MDLLEPLRTNWFLNSSGRMTRRIEIVPSDKMNNLKNEYQIRIVQIMKKTNVIEGSIIGLVA
jgi:hypothetical protein